MKPEPIYWYSMRQVAKQLGISVNTFKKYYLPLFAPDRQNACYKGYTRQSLERIRAHILHNQQPQNPPDVLPDTSNPPQNDA